MVSFAKVEKCQYGAFHWPLLEPIFNCLEHSSNLIATALPFMKTGLETTEYIVGFDNVVETIGKNTFQKFDGT